MSTSNLENSPSFCILPWIHINVMPDSTVIPCCISPYNDIFGDGKLSDLNTIWNSEKFKALRVKMLTGEIPEGCARCHTLESTGFQSMRQEMNKYFEKYIPMTKLTLPDGHIEHVNLKYIDVRFSNLCNFKCRGCGPTLSSAWFEDHQALYNYNSSDQKVKSIETNSPNFWKELKSLIPFSDVIYFGGGEPLITKEHYEILLLLVSLSRFDIVLRYNTNLSVLTYQKYDLTSIWSNFKNVNISISIDDIGIRAEYFRHGTNWSKIEQNIEKLIKNHPQIDLFINCTVSIFNVYYLPEIYDYFISRKYLISDHFRINLLLDPVEIRCDVFPIEAKKVISKKLRKFLFKINCNGNEHNFFTKEILNVLNFINSEDHSELLPNFFNTTEKLDKIRGESFSETFPELKVLLTK